MNDSKTKRNNEGTMECWVCGGTNHVAKDCFFCHGQNRKPPKGKLPPKPQANIITVVCGGYLIPQLTGTLQVVPSKIQFLTHNVGG